MAAQEDQQRAAARQRGAQVLLDLAVRAGLTDEEGRTGLAEIARRSVEAASGPDSGISDQTVRNLLVGRAATRARSVELFIGACLLRQQDNPQLADEKGTAAYWKARFDDALGRVGDASAGLVRVGQPLLLADTFVHRPNVGLVAAAIDAGQTVVLTHSTSATDAAPVPRPQERVLVGLGGVGKSQLAAQYARQVWNDPTLDLVIWTAARDPGTIVQSYADAATQLLGVDHAQPEHAAARLMAWLSTTTRPWLIVLDDVQVPAEIQQWWPEPTEAGQVIVTTRFRGDSLRRTNRQVIEVGLYTAEQALDYLRRRLADVPHLHHDNDGQATDDLLNALAKDLGYLPLALAHASAYLREEQVSVLAYRAMFADQHTRLETLFVAHTADFPDPYLYTVATTWLISVTKAAELVPGGVVPVVMLLASILDPDGIPRALFTAEPITNYLDGLLGRPVEQREVLAAVRVLHRFNLLTDDPTAHPTPVIRVHGLVQRASRDAVETQPPHVKVGDAAWAAADALIQVWPAIERDIEMANLLRSNAQVLTEVSKTALWSPNRHLLLFHTGTSMGETGLVTAAVAYFDWLRNVALTRWGPDHPDTFAARSNLAIWRGEAGDPAGAVAAHAELLDDMVRVLDPDDPLTLTTRANFAYWRGRAEDPAGAVAAFADLLDDMVRVLGPDHTETFIARHNLAAYREEVDDDHVKAAAAYAELLEDRQRVLGPDHPHTLKTRDSLAASRGRAGDVLGAAAAYAELVKDRQRVLGPDQLDTFASRGKLAQWRGEAGDPTGAVAAFTELLDDMKRVLEPDNPDILNVRGQVAQWRGKAGDPAGAVTAFTKLLDDAVRVLGADHPDTLGYRGNLALWRALAGDPAGAVTAFTKLLDDAVRVLGADHPDTLTTRQALAYCQELKARM